jgi:hypothetical protein
VSNSQRARYEIGEPSWFRESTQSSAISALTAMQNSGSHKRGDNSVLTSSFTALRRSSIIVPPGSELTKDCPTAFIGHHQCLYNTISRTYYRTFEESNGRFDIENSAKEFLKHYEISGRRPYSRPSFQSSPSRIDATDQINDLSPRAVQECIRVNVIFQWEAKH